MPDAASGHAPDFVPRSEPRARQAAATASSGGCGERAGFRADPPDDVVLRCLVPYSTFNCALPEIVILRPVTRKPVPAQAFAGRRIYNRTRERLVLFAPKLRTSNRLVSQDDIPACDRNARWIAGSGMKMKARCGWRMSMAERGGPKGASPKKFRYSSPPMVPRREAGFSLPDATRKRLRFKRTLSHDTGGRPRRPHSFSTLPSDRASAPPTLPKNPDRCVP
jgi:hypothetical protein